MPDYTSGNNTVLTVSDIEIGAVELKDSDTDNRVNIKAANTARTTGTLVIATQPIDAAGVVLSTANIPAKGQALMAASMPIVIASDHSTIGITPAATEAHLGAVGGATNVVGDETTRPTNTTPYAAGDAISATVSDTATTVLRGLAVGRAAAAQNSGYITKIRLMTDQVACVARIRVHLYTLATPTGAVVGDNVQMTLLYLNKAIRIGHVDLPAFATSTVSTNSTAAVSSDTTIRMAFRCVAGDVNIYYRLETLDIFTPANAQKFYLEATVEVN